MATHGTTNWRQKLIPLPELLDLSYDRAVKTTTQWVWLLAGWLALALGFIGIFLPLLPTTPFVLLAAFCFSKGSEKMHSWLLQHKAFGPLIRDWQLHRRIRRRAKVLATICIIPVFASTLIFVHVGFGIKAIVASIGLWALTFIWLQKE